MACRAPGSWASSSAGSTVLAITSWIYCPDLALVVEVDGDSHFSAEAVCHDQVRDAHLVALGLRVIRFTNDEIMCTKGCCGC